LLLRFSILVSVLFGELYTVILKYRMQLDWCPVLWDVRSGNDHVIIVSW